MSNVTQAKLNQNSNFFKDKSWLIFSCIIALMVGVMVLYFFQTHERVIDTPKYNLTPKATANRFLASEKLLQAEHKKVTITKGEVAKTALDNLWLQPIRQAKHNAVILYSVSKNQEASIPDMLRWVENGGHLVTFSQDTMRYSDPDKSPDDEDIRQYEQSENLLLKALGIRHVQNERVKNTTPDPTEDKAESDSATADTSQSQPQRLAMNEKVVMRLPKVTQGKIEPNVNVESVIHIDTDTHLDTAEFWQNYPNAQKWADYNWLNDSGQLVAPNQTVLNTSEQQQLATYINQQKQKYNPSLKAEDVMLDVKLGEGRITVLNSKYIFTNPSSYDLQKLANSQSSLDKAKAKAKDNATHSPLWQLLQNTYAVYDEKENVASLDNAYLLKYLMTDREQIWIVPDIDVPSLPVMLWRSAQWACLAFLLLLAVGMLALPKRFGRIRTYQTDSERNIFGYFDHVGQYLWQTDEAKAIFTQNRIRLIEQIIAKQPHFAKLDPEQLCQAISEQLNIGKSAVKQGLYNDWNNADQFLQCTRQFAVIRQAYN